MKQMRILWDMPITVDIRDDEYTSGSVEAVYEYFQHIDDVFSTFKPASEISRFNRGELSADDWSTELTEVVALCEQTRLETRGYFSYMRHGVIEPLGLVKGWALKNAGDMLQMRGVNNFFIDAGGDVELHGYMGENIPWTVGIRDPFYRNDIVKKLFLTDCGIATSGTYIRGYHIYNPFTGTSPITDIISLSVIGPNVYEADRFATAAFAMGRKGIEFIESVTGLEGYQIDERGIATYTSGFDRFVAHYGHHWIG
jgi:thiamine biosynthesis lipoprotein